MNPGGDAAEQVVRLSLEGFEVAARLSGAAAKDVALLLASVLKEQTKTKGKARLTSMLRSGKELKVFSLPQKDLKEFTKQAKRYGVLYCVLRDKNQDGSAPVDIIARADDASKIQRIVERYQLGTIDKATVVGEAQDRVAQRDSQNKDEPERTPGERIAAEAIRKETKEEANPSLAKTDKGPLSEQNSKRMERPDKGEIDDPSDRPSVKIKLNNYTEQVRAAKEAARSELANDPLANQTLHKENIIKKKGISK
ncbi:MAG: PcfB family protein [Erysipelotrichaceae bacterium]|nr:PcfB family protein [Erysipelotrichaceae bacterium]